MKQWKIIVIHTLLLIGVTAGALKSYDKDSEKFIEKSSDKVYPKKVLSIKKKPTKSPILKSPIDSFKDLPEDDLEFIKELDKQFKLHGDKIKIKVERDNSTSKNSKRTVEGDLGYGYYKGQESGGGYDYPKPKYTFYPYSQHDIPASAPGYQIKNEDQSTISIVPSYAYELKENDHGSYDTKSPFTPSQPDLGPTPSYHHQDEGRAHGYQQNDPVIVLKIPGPTKYASHLQSLLQQYLEIRAAQYLKILEEAEHQKLQQQQHQHQEQYQQYEHVQEKPHQEVPYDHPQAQPEEPPQGYAYAAPQQYPAIDDVYQSFKGRQQQESQHQIEEQHQQYHQPEPSVTHGDQQQQQYFYVNVQEEDQSAHQIPAQAPGPRIQYQTMYYYAMEPPDNGQHNVYVIPQGYDDSPLPITENNPRSTHTKVHFIDGDNTDHSTQYPLPSIKPFERHAPKATPVHENYQTHEEVAAVQAADYQHQQPSEQQYYHASSSSAPQVVAITQRPFNYHAHSLRSKSSKRNAMPTSASSSHSRRRIHMPMNRQRNADKMIVPRRAKKEVGGV